MAEKGGGDSLCPVLAEVWRSHLSLKKKFHFVVLVTDRKLFCVPNCLHMGKNESTSELALSVIGGCSSFRSG